MRRKKELVYVIIYSYYDSHLSQTHYMHIHKTTILKFNHKFNHISIPPNIRTFTCKH